MIGSKSDHPLHRIVGTTMVITCPNCEAKYKLPGEKLKGRGAKITCPRCSHVFVIFNKEADAGTSPAPSASGELSEKRRATPPGPVSAGEGQVPLPAGLRAEDIFTSDYGGGDQPQPVAGSGGASLPSEPAEPAEQSVESPSGRERLSVPGLGRLDAEALDFKALGVQTWKVKVAIGLIYDFSDIRTLRKSMREKKVTYDDQISPDGVDWVRIGSDAELETYFKELYEVKLAEQGPDGAPATPSVDKKPVLPATSGEMPAATGGIGGPSSNLGKDAFKVELARPKRPRRARPAPKLVERKILGLKPAVFGIVLAVVVVLGLVVTLGGRDLFGGGGENPAIPESRVTSEQLEKIQEAARLQIDEDLRQQRADLADEASDEAPADTQDVPSGDGYAHLRSGEPLDTSQLEPVTPEPIIQPPEPTPAPVVEQPPEPTPAPPPESTATVEETTADDWFLLGDMALGSGNCSGAVPSLEKAVRMESGNLNFNYKLGIAYLDCGRSADAVGPLSKAASAIPDAQKRLDEIQGGGSE